MNPQADVVYRPLFYILFVAFLMIVSLVSQEFDSTDFEPASDEEKVQWPALHALHAAAV